MELRTYIESEILPLYLGFDRAHGPEHARAVIDRSLALAEIYGLDLDMVYTAAAYHDTGLSEGRERHHLVSGRIIRADRNLRKWFNEEQIETIAQAAEDHRASADREPRSIYGRILAEADRQIDPELTVRRTVQSDARYNTASPTIPRWTKRSTGAAWWNTSTQNMPKAAI